MEFRKSSFCDSSTCVEVAATPAAVLLRDSSDVVLSVTREAWSAFLADVRAGLIE